MLDTWRMHSSFFSAVETDIYTYWIPWQVPCFQVTSWYLKVNVGKIVNIFHAHFLCVIWSSCKQNADAHRTSIKIRLTKLQFRQSIILNDIKIIFLMNLWARYGYISADYLLRFRVMSIGRWWPQPMASIRSTGARSVAGRWQRGICSSISVCNDKCLTWHICLGNSQFFRYISHFHVNLDHFCLRQLTQFDWVTSSWYKHKPVVKSRSALAF